MTEPHAPGPGPEPGSQSRSAAEPPHYSQPAQPYPSPGPPTSAYPPLNPLPADAPSSIPDADGEWRRLSPRMLLVHPVQELIRFLPVLVALVIGGTAGGGGGHYWSLLGLALAVALGLSRWFTTTYRVTTQQVQLRKGLLRKRSLAAPIDRVRTVDVTANPLHRMLGLTRLSIGTGISDKEKDGLLLDGMTAAEAARLRAELLHHRGPQAAAADGHVGRTDIDAPEDVVVRWSPAWVRYGPFSLSGLVTIGAVLALLSRAVNEGGVDPERYGPVRSTVHTLSEQSPLLLGLGALVAFLLVVAVASTGGYLLAFWNFRLTRRRDDGTLHVTRGLLTTRATTIEEARLQGLELSEPLLLRAVGGARLIAIATGLRVGRGAERGGSMLLPPAPGAEADRVAAVVLTEPAPASVGLRRHGPAATRRRFTRALAAAVLLSTVLVTGCVLSDAGTGWRVAALLPLPAAVLLAVDRARALGHALCDGYLVARRGSMVRRRVMLQCDGVSGLGLRTSFFQRRVGLTTLTAATAAGRQGYPVPDIDAATALALGREIVPGLLEPFLVR